MIGKDLDQRKQEPAESVTDCEIVTERKVPRRSFLSASGLVLAGAAGIVSGSAVRAAAQDDPDKRPDDRNPEDRKPEDRRRPEDERKPNDRRKPDDRPKPDDTP